MDLELLGVGWGGVGWGGVGMGGGVNMMIHHRAGAGEVDAMKSSSFIFEHIHRASTYPDR